MLKALILSILVIVIVAKSPPVFNYSYHVLLEETVVKSKASYHIKSQWFYDPIKKKQRIDRETGIHDIFCSTILPNVQTPCQALNTDGNRWILFPQRSHCCLCCTSKHGCGILAPDWLKNASYMGEYQIDGEKFDKWHSKGAFTPDQLYVTTDGKEWPRRLDEGGKYIYDYDLKSFDTSEIPDSVFALPSYCNAAKPTHCPITSICEALRNGENNKLLSQQ